METLLETLQQDAQKSPEFVTNGGIIPAAHTLLSNHFGLQKGILQTLLSKKGQFGSITYRRPLKLLKQFVNEGVKAEKLTTLNVRCGIDYSNLQSVIEKEQSGEIVCNGKLSGRTWILFPYLLQTIKDNNLLFRFYTIEGQKAKSRYFIDGQEVTQEALPTYCLSSEYREKDFLPCFDLRVDYIMGVK